MLGVIWKTAVVKSADRANIGKLHFFILPPWVKYRVIVALNRGLNNPDNNTYVLI